MNDIETPIPLDSETEIPTQALTLPSTSFPAADIIKGAAARAIQDVQNPSNPNMLRMGAEMAPIIGGTAGAEFGPPGMAAGGAAGEALKQAYLQLTGEKPIDPMGAIKESLKQGVTQGVLGSVIEGGGKVLNYLKDKILPTVFNTTANVSKPLAEYFVKNPNVIDEVTGSTSDISNLVSDLQMGLKNTRDTIGNMLGQARTAAGVGMSEDQAIYALAKNQLTIKSPSDIATEYLAARAIPGEPADEIKTLYGLRNSIDDKLSFMPPGQVLGESENRANSILQTIRSGINDRLDTLAQTNPTAATLRDMDSHFQNVAQLYDTLRGTIGKEGSAEDYLQKVFTNDTGKNRAIIDSLQKLDQMTGQDMTGSLMKQFTAQAMNQMVGKKLLAAVALRDIILHGDIGQGASLLALSSPKFLSKAVQLGTETLGPVAHVLGHTFAAAPAVPIAAQAVNPLIEAIRAARTPNQLIGQGQETIIPG